jgi:hypothetical protein
MEMNMSPNTIFILVIISYFSFSFTNFIQKENTKIYWDAGRQLTWDDFIAKPPTTGDKGAVSFTSFKYSPSSELNNGILEIDIVCYFDKTKSWVKTTSINDNNLKHEQGHFDISEVYARKFRKTVFDSKCKKKGLNDKLKSFYTTYINELNKYQDLYDKETDHHRNEQKQIEWNEKIAKELKELEAYSETHLIIKLKR